MTASAVAAIRLIVLVVIESFSLVVKKVRAALQPLTRSALQSLCSRIPLSSAGSTGICRCGKSAWGLQAIARAIPFSWWGVDRVPARSIVTGPQISIVILQCGLNYRTKSL